MANTYTEPLNTTVSEDDPTPVALSIGLMDGEFINFSEGQDVSFNEITKKQFTILVGDSTTYAGYKLFVDGVEVATIVDGTSEYPYEVPYGKTGTLNVEMENVGGEEGSTASITVNVIECVVTPPSFVNTERTYIFTEELNILKESARAEVTSHFTFWDGASESTEQSIDEGSGVVFSTMVSLSGVIRVSIYNKDDDGTPSVSVQKVFMINPTEMDGTPHTWEASEGAIVAPSDTIQMTLSNGAFSDYDNVTLNVYSGTFDDSVDLSSVILNDTPVYNENVGHRTSGDSVSFTLPGDIASGSYFVIVIADGRMPLMP